MHHRRGGGGNTNTMLRWHGQLVHMMHRCMSAGAHGDSPCAGMASRRECASDARCIRCECASDANVRQTRMCVTCEFASDVNVHHTRMCVRCECASDVNVHNTAMDRLGGDGIEIRCSAGMAGWCRCGAAAVEGANSDDGASATFERPAGVWLPLEPCAVRCADKWGEEWSP